MKTMRKLLSGLLVVSLLIGMIPANTLNASTVAQTEIESQAGATAEKAVITGEIEDLRDKNNKHFRMSDGTIAAASYTEAVHYLKDGKWEDIDNSLSDSRDKAGDSVLENKNNSYKVQYAKSAESAESAGSKNLVDFSFNGNEISWSLESGKAVAVKQKDLAKTADESADASADTESDTPAEMTTKNTKSAVDYEEILPGIDLEYVTKGEAVKENIILKSTTSQNSLSFIYDFNGLVPKLNEDNSISLYDPENSQNTGLIIAAPYMYDANMEYSPNVKMTIEKQGSKYKITLTADKEWLAAKERAYPVVIDPTLQTTANVSSIRDAFVCSDDPNSIYYNNIEFLRAAWYNTGIKDNIYIRFENMPVLKSSDQVVSSKLVLIPFQCYSSESKFEIRNNFNPSPIVSAYQVQSMWYTKPEQGTPVVTYNSQPTCSTTVLDYAKFETPLSATELPAYTWDVTKAAKDWYRTGNNYGIQLKMNAMTPSSTWAACFVSSDYLNNQAAGDRPALVVSYRNASGLESYYSYHSQATGRAGTGYVNDYTGNVVLTHNDVTTTGNLMPVSLNHIYGNDKRVTAADYNNNNIVSPKYGNGWSLDAIQRIDSCDIQNYPYIYTDGDGTQHYFYDDPANPDNIYVDEDGLGLKLQAFTPAQVVDGIWFAITDKSGAQIKFDGSIGNGGFMRKMTDLNGNSITYNYVSGLTGLPAGHNKLSTIVDGAGRTTTLEYNTGNGLTGIVDPAGRRTTYTYTSGNLTTITYPDGETSTYEYNGPNGSLSKITNCDGYSIEYTYSGTSAPYRASSVCEKNGTSGGNSFSIDYSQYNTTTFSDNNDSDNVATYQFNDWGNTVSVLDKQGNAANYNYNNATTASIKNNTISATAQCKQTVVNLLPDPSFETGLTTWVGSGSGTTTTETSNVLIGNTMLKATNSTTDGYQTAFLNPASYGISPVIGKSYTVSVYMKTSNVASTLGNGAGILIEYYHNGVRAYNTSGEWLTGTTDSAVDNGWHRVSVTFALGTGDVFTGLYLGIINGTGTVYMDGAQFEIDDSMNQYNLVENSSFERNTGNNSTPTGWTSSNMLSTDGANNSAGNHSDGAYSFKVAGEPAKDKLVYQIVNTKGTEGDVYSLSAWAKADSSHKGNDDRFAMCIRVDYADGTTTYTNFPFNPCIGTGQTLSETFAIDDGNPATNKSYLRLYVYFLYYFNSNTAYVDNVQLYKDVNQSYQYDNNGNLVSTADLAKQSSSFAYSNDSLSKMANPDGTSYEYIYDTAKRVTSAKSSEGLKYNLTYDSTGNPLSTEILNDSSSTSITPGKTYYIRSKVSGKYLNVNNNGTADETPVKQLTLSRATSQQWKVTDAGGGYYRLTPQNARIKPWMWREVPPATLRCFKSIRLITRTRRNSN